MSQVCIEKKQEDMLERELLQDNNFEEGYEEEEGFTYKEE